MELEKLQKIIAEVFKCGHTGGYHGDHICRRPGSRFSGYFFKSSWVLRRSLILRSPLSRWRRSYLWAMRWKRLKPDWLMTYRMP